MTKLSEEKVKEAIKGSLGVRSRIARACDVSPSALTQWLDLHPEIDLEIKQERDKIVDVAEDKLIEIMNDGGIKDANTFHAVMKVLNNLGRERGWADKIDINSRNINLNQDVPWNAKNMHSIYMEIQAEREKGPQQIELKGLVEPIGLTRFKENQEVERRERQSQQSHITSALVSDVKEIVQDNSSNQEDNDIEDEDTTEKTSEEKEILKEMYT